VAVSKWLNETYSKIAKHAKTEHVEIQWGDETGLRSDDVRGRGYAPRGKTPVVRVNINRQPEHGNQQRADALEGLFRRVECQDTHSLSGAAYARPAEKDHSDPR